MKDTVVLGSQLLASMVDKELDRVIASASCPDCGTRHQYIRKGERLFYDDSCDCVQVEPIAVDWQRVAETINVKRGPEARRLKEGFGINE